MNIEKEFAELKEIIRSSSTIAKKYFDEDNTQKEEKAEGDFVTKAELDIETALVDYIKEKFPDDEIVGEEHGNHAGTSGYVWHIDPIDGTGNFLRKVPFFCVSVARLGDTPEDSFAIVYNPVTDHMFSSLMENGVYLNERVVKLEAYSLEDGKQVFSIGYGKEQWTKVARYKLYELLGTHFGKCTTYGSIALELAYLSANRIDGQVALDCHSYDCAAGLFLAKSAGASISVLQEDGGWKLWEGSIKELCAGHGMTTLVTHSSVHDEAKKIIGNPKNLR